MPVSRKPDTATPRPARRNGQAWTLELEREEEKGTLNVRLPKSIIDDIKLLSGHFDSSDQVVVERCLKFALGSNKELQDLKTNVAIGEAARA